jgi:hypothetical protein
MSNPDDLDPCDHHGNIGNLRERVQAIEDYLGIKRVTRAPEPAPKDPEPEPPVRKPPVRRRAR